MALIEKKTVDWNSSELSAWARLHLPSVVCEALEANEVDGSTFLALTPEDIRQELQISSLRWRKELALVVTKLRCTGGVDDFDHALELQRREVESFVRATKLDAPESTSSDVASVKLAAQFFGGFVDDAAAVVSNFKAAARFDDEDTVAARDVLDNREASRELQAVCDQARVLEAADCRVARTLAGRLA